MADRNYGAIRSVEELEKFVNRMIQSGKDIGFDIEAGYTGPDREYTALQQYHPNWLFTGFSFTISTEWARYVPVNHDAGGNVDDRVTCARLLWRMLMSGKIVAHNAAYEVTGTSAWLREMLWNDPLVGAEIRETLGSFPIKDDTWLTCWLSAEYAPPPQGPGKDLKSLCDVAFGLKMTHFIDLFPAEESELGPILPKAKKRFARFNTRNAYAQPVIDYACEDAVGTLMLHEKHYEKPYGSAEIPMKDSFPFKFEHGLIHVLWDMERGPVDPATGRALGNLYLDWDAIHAKAKECAEFRDKMGEEIQQMLGERVGRTVAVNLNSIPQMRKILYDPAPEGLGLPINDKFRSEKTHEPSTSDDALRVMAKDDEVIRKILDYRQVVKLYGSYLHKFETDIDYAGTGVVFPNHNQAGALTGRMSVDHVSYQQWPKPYDFTLRDGTKFEFNFRNIMISPDEYRIIGYDYSQVELRVLAGQAQETAMLKAFADGIDIHVATASSMLRIPIVDVSKKQRGVGKTCNFAVVYGSGPANIADMLSAQGSPTTKEQAVEMLDMYYAGFPNLRRWMDMMIASGREQGFVETPFGRKFTVWEFQDHRDWIRNKGDRMCVNAPIQGGAADYMKIAMNRVRKAIREAEADGRIPKDGIRLVMMVHDALEFYVHKSVDTQTVLDLLNPCVSFPVKGLPEIKADWHEGTRWGLVVELGVGDDGRIDGYSWEDPDGTKHKFEALQEAYDFQESWVSAKAAKGIEQIEAHLTEHVTSEEKPMVFMDDNPDLSKVPDGTTVYPPAAMLAKDISDAFDSIEEGLRTDPEARRFHLDTAIRRGDYVLVDGPRDRAKPLSGDELKQRLNEDTDAARAVKAGAKRLTREEYDDIIANGFPELRDAAPPEPEKTVVIKIAEMPDEDTWNGFTEWLDGQHGDRTVKIETPDGTMTLDQKYGLDDSDQGMVSLLLGGASLTVLTEAVDLDILDGVHL